MILDWIELAIVLFGFACAAALFYRIPVLPKSGGGGETGPFPTVSVIIPARNEEKNLPLLLKDLREQTLPPLEILCVNDASEDGTAKAARAFQAKLISVYNKPAGWTGKTWACQIGADAAKGRLLLFLDADVRLQKDSLRRLLQAYTVCGCAVSVQPYHQPVKAYEQMSMMLNLTQVAANGMALRKSITSGLFGPVILISQKDYQRVGGHESVRKSVVEDMALGRRLQQSGIPYRLFVGDPGLSFRMYAESFKSLKQGWVKNIAAGAARTPPTVFWKVFFWIASLISVPLHILWFAAAGKTPWLFLYLFLYAAWGSYLFVLSRKIGQFRVWAKVLYPLSMAVMLWVFAVSLVKRMFGLGVTWKGRSIISEEKP